MPKLRKAALYRKFASEPLRKKQPLKIKGNDKTLIITVSLLSSIVLLAITISQVLLTIVEMTIVHIAISLLGIALTTGLQAMAINYFLSRMNEK